MSDAPPPAPKKKPLLRRFLPSTVPGCAAILTLLFMIVAVAVVAAAFYFDSNNLPWRHAIGIPRIAIILLLVLIVPTVLFFALRLWLEGEKRLYPDIDNAWKAGINALEEQGLDIKDLACFLVLGSRSIGQERAIMQTGQLDLRVDGVPDGPAPIHWYATPDEVFIFCSDSSWSSALAAKRQRHFEEFGPQKSRSLANVGSTLPKNLGSNKRNSPAGQAGNETVQLEQFLQGEGAGFAASYGFGTDTSNAGTVEVDDYASRSEFDAAAISDSGTESAPIILSSVQATDRIGRLTYVCQQLVRVRQPLSPINGILSLLPQGAISRGGDDAAALEQAVKSDLSAIRTTLQVRCPVTALVTDLEREVGFRELMRRVGKERVSQQRFGRRFDCRSLPTQPKWKPSSKDSPAPSKIGSMPSSEKTKRSPGLATNNSSCSCAIIATTSKRTSAASCDTPSLMTAKNPQPKTASSSAAATSSPPAKGPTNGPSWAVSSRNSSTNKKSSNGPPTRCSPNNAGNGSAEQASFWPC